jgi:phytoene dehydrogenase-like protein
VKKSIIIIGAGIAGLSAGCYARMNGYPAQIFEMHTVPGGLCTAWKRRGRSASAYTFDGCIHHLAGSGPGSKVHEIWNDLGVFERHTMLFHDNLVRVELSDGQALTIYTDIDRLEAYLKDLSPADAPLIDGYIRAARRLLGFDLLALPVATPGEMLKIVPRLPMMIKWGGITLDQFGSRFQHPLLRQAIPTIQYDFPDVPVLLHLNFLAGCHNQTLGWPSGGSLAFAQTIAQRFEDLGGEMAYRSRVSKVLVEDDRAVGVRLEDGTEHRADVVVSACDGHATIFDMLDGKYADGRIRAYYDAAPDEAEMSLCVSLGVARDMADAPHALTYFLEEPVTVMGRPHDRLDVEIFNFDPALAPEGKTPIKVLFKAGYDYWKALAADRARYDEEKQQIAETVIAQLNKRFPGLAQQVEVIDVATPLTIERFTGNWHGLQAWTEPPQMLVAAMQGLTRTLPGLGNFYMVGQWVGGIGISTAAISGRNLIKRLCKRDGKGLTTGV